MANAPSTAVSDLGPMGKASGRNARGTLHGPHVKGDELAGLR